MLSIISFGNFAGLGPFGNFGKKKNHGKEKLLFLVNWLSFVKLKMNKSLKILTICSINTTQRQLI